MRLNSGDFLPVGEAARRLGIGYSTLKAWIYRGTIRTTRTAGGHHRIPAGEVERFLNREQDEPGSSNRPARVVRGTITSISGRNQLRAIVDEVRIEGLLAQVRLRIGDQTLTAVITRDAVDELRLRRGEPALAIIKSTEVMVATEAQPGGRRRTRRG